MQLAGETERPRVVAEPETNVGLDVAVHGLERVEAEGKRVGHRAGRRRALHQTTITSGSMQWLCTTQSDSPLRMLNSLYRTYLRQVRALPHIYLRCVPLPHPPTNISCPAVIFSESRAQMTSVRC